MLRFAVNHDGPVAIRYPRGAVPGEVFDSQGAFKPGSAEIVWDAECPLAVVWAVGHLVSEAVSAAAILRRGGIEITVVDPMSIKPLDAVLLRDLSSRCRNIITVEENIVSGGFGSSVGEWLAAEALPHVWLKCVGLPDRFIEHASQGELRAQYGLDAAGIANAVKEMIAVQADAGAEREDVEIKVPRPLETASQLSPFARRGD
jgi:1-deoxy-D-xylulose-5-phosphate synthase